MIVRSTVHPEFETTLRKQILAAVIVVVVTYGTTVQGGEKLSPPLSFPQASVHFEQNSTDGDVEVVFDVKAGDQGLSKLAVVSPDDRRVIDFTAPDASTLGIRQFHFESPEPLDVDGLKSAYPQGVYAFRGEPATGDRFHGTSTLNHKLPATVSFLQPQADDRQVRIEDLEITWTTVENVAAYIVEIEQDELDVNLTAKLPASASGFAVPHGLLRPATPYQLSIGSVSKEGNISFVETTFTTAEKK